MAGLREMALGVASVLQHSGQPEPLPVEMWNSPPDHAAQLVRAVIDECADGGVALGRVVVDRQVAQLFESEGARLPMLYRGVRVDLDPDFGARVEFYRAASDDDDAGGDD